MSTYAEAARYLDRGETVAREDVRRWIDSGDLLTWGAVYELLRLHPELIGDDHIDFSRRYLLRCLEENPRGGDYLHGGYEAAWELAACLKRWSNNKVLRGIAIDLDKLYRRGDHATRNRILGGVLEHAFEDSAVRPFFANWERDENLREAYRLALEWGAAHE
jgi:hypothetical protein